MYKCQYCEIELSQKILMIHEPQCKGNITDKLKEEEKEEKKEEKKEDTRKKKVK